MSIVAQQFIICVSVKNLIFVIHIFFSIVYSQLFFSLHNISPSLRLIEHRNIKILISI